MIETLHTIASFVVALGVLIAVHEYGHFLAARRLGVKVERFSIGFGPAIWRRVGRDGVEYVIAAIPLGGYVKMLGESGSGEVAEIEALPPEERARAFDAQPVWKRAVIAAAGPAFNLLFAVAAYALAAWLGLPAHPAEIGAVTPGSPAAEAGLAPGMRVVAVDGRAVRSWEEMTEALRAAAGRRARLSVDDGGATEERALLVPAEPAERLLVDPADVVGLRPPVAVVIAAVRPGSPAAEAGLKAGDVVLAANGEPLVSARALGRIVERSAGAPVTLRLRRGDQERELLVRPARDGAHWRIGVALGERWQVKPITVRRGPLEGLIYGLEKTWAMTALTVEVLGKMLSRAISPENLGGPIAIAKLSGQAAEAGLVAFLLFLGLISVNLAVLNLLPIPVLDGGHLLLLAVEAARGRPLSPRALGWVQGVGAALIGALMVFAFYNDIARLMRGG